MEQNPKQSTQNLIKQRKSLKLNGTLSFTTYSGKTINISARFSARFSRKTG